MNSQISFRQLIAFIRSLGGLTTWQRIQLVAYMVGSGLMAGAAGKNEHEMVSLAIPAALVTGVGYIHALSQPPTIGKAANVDAQGRTHL